MSEILLRRGTCVTGRSLTGASEGSFSAEASGGRVDAGLCWVGLWCGVDVGVVWMQRNYYKGEQQQIQNISNNTNTKINERIQTQNLPNNTNIKKQL